MSWIRDVRNEVAGLDLSKSSLRKFGLLVGGILIVLSLWFIFRSKWETARIILLVIGSFLLLAGFFFPFVLKGLYKIWMGLAFAIGWVVSRILIAILFYLVVTPAGIVARLTGKKFLDVDMREKKESYWIVKSSEKKNNYEKMY